MNMVKRVMINDTRLAGVSVLNIRSIVHQEASIDNKPVLSRTGVSKSYTRADGKAVDVMQLIDVSDLITDVKVHVCRSGYGVVGF